MSKSTVSLVLQGSSLIRAETAARVRQAADALGYVYNRAAADLRRKSSNVVGMVINDLTNPFFAELLVGMERKLMAAGYVSLMTHTGESLETQAKVLASLREYNAAGLMFCPAFGTPASVLGEIRSRRIPLLLLVRPLGDKRYDFVGADNEAGTFLATEHLIQRGHRRIAFLGRKSVGAIYERRRKGFERAMRTYGLRIVARYVIDVAPTREGGREGIRQALSLDPPPSAAVCYNDIVAFGALGELGERGIAAGKDFAVVGFDGVADAAHSNPPLTTVAVDPSQLGEAAADTLLRRLRDPGHAPLRYVAKPRLVVRQSSGGNVQSEARLNRQGAKAAKSARKTDLNRREQMENQERDLAAKTPRRQG